MIFMRELSLVCIKGPTIKRRTPSRNANSKNVNSFLQSMIILVILFNQIKLLRKSKVLISNSDNLLRDVRTNRRKKTPRFEIPERKAKRSLRCLDQQ